jgi:hypothetical protein
MKELQSAVSKKKSSMPRLLKDLEHFCTLIIQAFMKRIALIALIISLIAGVQEVRAQENLPTYDLRTWHFGFNVGVSSTNYKLNRSQAFWKNDTMKSVYSNAFPGFTLGVLANLHLGNHFDLRMLPNIAFGQRNISYEFKDSTQAVAKIENAYLELPVVMKFKSTRHRNVRFYVLTGIVYGYDLSSNKSADRKPGEAFIAVQPHNLGYQIGCGFDLYFPYFKFSPEIKLTNGINNVLVRDGSLYSSMIEGLFSKVISFNFYFE